MFFFSFRTTKRSHTSCRLSAVSFTKAWKSIEARIVSGWVELLMKVASCVHLPFCTQSCDFTCRCDDCRRERAPATVHKLQRHNERSRITCSWRDRTDCLREKQLEQLSDEIRSQQLPTKVICPVVGLNLNERIWVMQAYCVLAASSSTSVLPPLPTPLEQVNEIEMPEATPPKIRRVQLDDDVVEVFNSDNFTSSSHRCMPLFALLFQTPLMSIF